MSDDAMRLGRKPPQWKLHAKATRDRRGCWNNNICMFVHVFFLQRVAASPFVTLAPS